MLCFTRKFYCVSTIIISTIVLVINFECKMYNSTLLAIILGILEINNLICDDHDRDCY